MSRAQRAPFGIDSARNIFDFVQCVLHQRPDITFGGQPGPTIGDAQNRLHAQIFAPVEKFQDAQTIAQTIAPRARPDLTFFQWADGIFPLIVPRIEIIAARKTQKLWLHRRHFLHQIGSQTVGTILVRRRKQRNHLHPDRARRTGANRQTVGLRRRHIAGSKRARILLPRGCQRPGARAGKVAIIEIAFEADSQFAR